MTTTIEKSTAWCISVHNAYFPSSAGLKESFLSPNTKLVTESKMALISNPILAQQFIDAVMPVMRKRHGKQVQLSMVCAPSSQSAKRSFDDSNISTRIERNNFAPNIGV